MNVLVVFLVLISSLSSLWLGHILCDSSTLILGLTYSRNIYSSGCWVKRSEYVCWVKFINHFVQTFYSLNEFIAASSITYQEKCVNIFSYDWICSYLLLPVVSDRDRVQTLAIRLSHWCSSPLAFLPCKIEEDDSKDQRQFCSIIFYETGIVLGRIEQDGKFR